MEVHRTAAAFPSRVRRAGPLLLVHGGRALHQKEARAAGHRSTAPHGPHLHRMDDLRAIGWLFLPVIDGELRGLRVWYPGWIDKLRLRDADDLAAVRHDPAGTLVWRRDGSSAEVVDAIVALPAPLRWSPQ